ncbi:MAG: hypothetical protein ACKVQR_15080 [Aquabacterium sp.]
MRRTLFALTCTAALLAAALPALHAHAAARAEALDIDDKDRALLSKETIKQKRTSAAQVANGKAGSRGTASSCGSVDIGNSDDAKKGSSRIAEREKTVIVTGNVFNTANCR